MNKTKILIPPFVQNYTQLKQYLNDYFTYRKSMEKVFSYEIWGAELGFKSRSFMRMISTGERNITPKVSSILSTKLGFTPEQEEYFSLLIQHNNAKTASQKKIYSEKMLEFTAVEPDLIEVKEYEKFLSSPYLSQIFLLVSFEDMAATEANLKKLVDVSTNELKKALVTLEKMGMIKSVPFAGNKKRWVSNSKSFRVPGKPKDKSIVEFHQQSLKEASQVLATNQAFRHFRSIYFSINEDATEELKQEVEIFLAKMKRKYAGGSLNKKRLVKLNLQAYPVSQVYTK